MSTQKKAFAQLVIPSKDAKRPLFYIKVYSIEYPSGKWKRKRYYKIPGSTFNQKIANGKRLAAQIDQLLKEGHVFDSSTSSSESKESFTILQAFNYVLAKKSNSRTAKKEGIPYHFRPYLEFLKSSEIASESINDISFTHAFRFEEYIRTKGVSNRTRNNYISAAKNIWNQLIEEELIDKSPFAKLKKLPTATGRNVIYTDPEKEKIKGQHALYPDLERLASFMYYTCARTTEIALLQIKHIGLYHPNKIYIPAANGKTGIERHINIPPQLKQIIQEMKLDQYPKDYYIFSFAEGRTRRYKPITPQAKPTLGKNLSKKYRKHILDPLGFTTLHTLYSWKHTGVAAAHDAGVKDADIMEQTGHQNYQSFAVYMKSIGRSATGQYAAKIPTL